MTDPNFKRRLTAFAAALTILVVTPLAVVAGHRFTDVPDSNIFHGDIHWLAEADVTRGCNPPANDQFCPGDNVTREQMAAFMHRLAVNRVVDAATAEEADHAATADEADHAATADEADHAATADEADHAATADEADHAATADEADHAASADDADTLDGKDSSTFVEEGDASSVTSEMIADEAGVALASNDSGDVGLLGPIVSVSLTAPTDGFVLAVADVQLIFEHASPEASQATVGLSTSDSAFTQNHQDNQVGIPPDAADGFHFASPGLTSIFPVTSGEVTIHLLGEENSGTVTFNDATISALFVSTSYGD